jgi:uncharacterized protein YecE (DUF72 family)
MRKGNMFIGTSGWKYKHWNGVFYPSDLKQKDQLNYYHQIFNTVELNNSFYRQPSIENFDAWRQAVPKHFSFAVKANRYFTHLKKLKVSAADVEGFLGRVSHLKQTLGPVLFQLPPGWKINLERLESFLKLLPQSFRYAFEFRNATWYHPEVYHLLTRYNVAFCIYELDGHISPSIQTADFVYVRLHGPGAKYQGSYNNETLTLWADFAKSTIKAGKDIFLYFDNDQNGYAAFNAQQLLLLSTDS